MYLFNRAIYTNGDMEALMNRPGFRGGCLV